MRNMQERMIENSRITPEASPNIEKADMINNPAERLSGTEHFESESNELPEKMQDSKEINFEVNELPEKMQDPKENDSKEHELPKRIETSEGREELGEGVGEKVSSKELEGLKDEIGEDRAETLWREVNALPDEIESVNDLEMGKDLSFSRVTENNTEQASPNSEGKLSDSNDEIKLDEPSQVKGGSYRDVKRTSDGDTHEVNHMPADSATNLERNDGPAIKMEKNDHRETASCGNSREAQEYRARQRELIEQGKFREALQMDIDDIHDKFGDKYDDAIAEMMDYVDKLEQEGKI